MSSPKPLLPHPTVQHVGADLELDLCSATKDLALPLSEPVRGRNGELMNEIVVPRGAMVLAHLQGSNSNKALWGEDALEWKPERWLAPLPDALTTAHIPGVYSNL